MSKGSTKPIKVQVNGKEFNSCNSAAHYIVSSEAIDGNVKRVTTITSEISKFVRSDRTSFNMYNKYEIERIYDE